MKDYTEIFSKAIELREEYDFYAVRTKLNSDNHRHCGDWDVWDDGINGYRLCSREPISYSECYGFICVSYPVALLTEYYPEELLYLLNEAGVLHTECVESMWCD